MAFHDDDEKEKEADLTEGAVDEVLDETDEDEDEVADLAEETDEKWE